MKDVREMTSRELFEHGAKLAKESPNKITDEMKTYGNLFLVQYLKDNGIEPNVTPMLFKTYKPNSEEVYGKVSCVLDVVNGFLKKRVEHKYNYGKWQQTPMEICVQRFKNSYEEYDKNFKRYLEKDLDRA